MSNETEPDGATLREDEPIPVVGVGASAGGLEAFTQLLTRLPEQSGMAFVLVQHLEPSHESHLRDILSKSTNMPVLEVEDGMPVAPDRIYVIPPNTNMALSDGKLRLSPRGEPRGVHLPIDFFFRSLAQDRHKRAIGVVLSGTGSDGTQGLSEIKAAGGITFAQDEDSAKFPGMPLSAAAGGVADFVLPPGEIALELARMGRHPYFRRTAEDPDKPFTGKEGDFARILALLRSTSGVDFALYRDSTLKRRILRRMALGRVETLSEYLRRLEKDPSEAAALYQDSLIHVTRFFRDPEVFEALAHTVLPQILQSKQPGETIRVWVAGCATGEEAYSLAILLREMEPGPGIGRPVRIFASDINESPSLEKARAGVYPESIEGDVSQERLLRFFTREGGGYRIRKEIREMCVFARHDVCEDPPFAMVDLISCRNVLIYLSAALQRRIFPAFHYALNPGGFLVLGNSETVGKDTDLFRAVDSKLKIYAKKTAPLRLPIFAPRNQASARPGSAKGVPRLSAPLEFQQVVDRLLLREFAPPGVLVNRDLDVLEFRGRTSPFLSPPQGGNRLNVFKMAPEGLSLVLREAVSESEKSGNPVLRKDVEVLDGESVNRVDLEILPIKLAGAEACFMILFKTPGNASSLPAPGGENPVPRGRRPDPDEEVSLLRRELASSREHLQVLREQCEAVSQELRGANEEMESSNEELQSTNEELETAKEELQSANEELSTMNEELQVQNQELGRLNEDLSRSRDFARAIVDTVREPLLILEKGAQEELRIQSANLSYYRLFGALPEDTEGRLLEEAAEGRWRIPGLLALLRKPDSRTGFENFEASLDWPGGRKTVVINARAILGEGALSPRILLAIEDITERRLAERNLRLLKFCSDQSSDSYYLMDRTAKFSYVNRSACEALGYAEPELLSLSLYQVEPTLSAEAFAKLFEQAHASRVPLFETEHAGKDGERFAVECSASGVVFEGEEFMLVIGRDIRERKRAQEALRKAEEGLRQAQRIEAIGRLAGGVAHEFNNLLTAINGYSALCLAEVPATGSLHDQLEEIHSAGQRAAGLTRQMLAYGRKQVMQFRVLDLNGVVAKLHGMLAKLIGERYRIVLSLDNSLGMVKADAGQMDQVLMNLVMNARDALPEGGEIVLGTRNADLDEEVATPPLPPVPPGSYVVLSVSDHGVGMEPEVRSRVFDPFFTTKEVGKGTGLGLSVVQGIVSQSGGHLLLQSAPGEGSVFSVLLPRDNSKPIPAVRKKRPLVPVLDGDETVLLVEDEEIVREFARKCLEKRGYAVLAAGSGESALDMAARHEDGPIELLVTDMVLPGIGGRELAGKFLDSHPQGKVLFVSGYSEDSLPYQEGERRIEAQFLQKPFDASGLAVAVREALGAASAKAR